MSENALLDTTHLALLEKALGTLNTSFSDLPSTGALPSYETMADVLSATAQRLHDNFPYAHPLYAGQMLKPPHPVARLAYQLAMYINPNNHALDGGRASSAMEKEAVAAIADMFGFKQHLGHLTSSGTIANLEALWIAGEIHPSKCIAASAESHYTHSRLSRVLKLDFQAMPVDREGRMRTDAVEALARAGNLGTLVATAGTTGSGVVDPIDELLALARQYDFRLHVDAAYGGYFTLLDDLPTHTRAAYDAIAFADSVAIDPHKHGLQPYGCGCVLFSDPQVGRHYKHDSPYTYFSSDELHLGEISLECSRAGAAAVALWATQQMLPMQRDGEFAAGLRSCRAAAAQLASNLQDHPDFELIQMPELDIVVWAVRSDSLSTSSALAQQLFDLAASENLHLALIEISPERLPDGLASLKADRASLTCLRSCLIKHEHEQWIERIWDALLIAHAKQAQ